MESEEILTSMTRRERVECLLRSFGGVVVACSGGVDSVLLAAVAARVLGDRAVAATAVSESLALGELEDARAAAKAAGIRHIEVRTREIENPAYSRNAPDRCFHCKDTAYGHFTDLAKELGLPVVVDGTNADDTGDYRPGRQAAREHGVRSPLAEAGLGKKAIREWARELGLGVWDKPAAACLSSRIPYGSEVTSEKLRRIELAEAALKAAGLRQCRVRDHDGLARIEVEPEALERVLELRDVLLPSFKGLGYAYVTVDLQGFRSGSMNEVISVPSPA